MRVSSDAHAMASLLLKYHPMSKQKIEQAPKANGQPQIKDKYSLDYTVFEKMTQQTDKPVENSQHCSDSAISHFAHTHDKRKERELFERPTQQKLDNAEFFKEEGNKAYSEKNYDKAVYMYEKAIVHFDYTFPENSQQEARMQQLKEKCHLNLALSFYCLKEYDEVLTNLRQVLLLNPKNIKALYRQAIVAYDRDEFDNCSDLLRKIVEADNGKESKEVTTLRQDLQKRYQEYQLKSRKVAASMLQ